MIINDAMRLSYSALLDQRLRSGLTILGIAVGIASVVLLTSIGEGLHRFVLSEFTQFGANLVAVNPGKTTTAGMSGAIISNVRPLSLADDRALGKISGIIATVPLVQGNAAVEFEHRHRRVYVFGVGSEVPRVWNIPVSIGRFLSKEDVQSSRSVAVIGKKVLDELFQGENPLGKNVRIGGERYRVIGVMAAKGQLLGFDLDDAVYIPTPKALSLFNRESLMEIDLLYHPGLSSIAVGKRVKEVLSARHGMEDFTITTQDQMISVLGSVLSILTLAVGALGSISLVVGGVGILTIMTITVSERTSEIGLMCALGAKRREILILFLIEAVVLAGIGGIFGLLIGAGGAWILGILLPALPTHIAWRYVILAECLAGGIGLAAGVLPARRASRLDPVEALRTE